MPDRFSFHRHFKGQEKLKLESLFDISEGARKITLDILNHGWIVKYMHVITLTECSQSIFFTNYHSFFSGAKT